MTDLECRCGHLWSTHAVAEDGLLFCNAFPTCGCDEDVEMTDDELAALTFWNQVIRPTVSDLPPSGQRFLREQYVKDVQANPAALEKVLEWFEGRE